MDDVMNWLKRLYWRYRWRQAYPLMHQAKQEYESLVAANKLVDAARVYKVYARHRRAAIHYAMKLARK